jgi:hypothetical protein
VSELFPELEGDSFEGAERPKAPPRAPRKAVTEAPSVVLLGDRATLRRFERILALEVLGASVRAVELHEGNRLEIAIGGEAVVNAVVFVFRGVTEGRILGTNELSFGVKGSFLHPTVVPVLRVINYRLSRTRFDDLAKLVRHDALRAPITRTGLDRGDSFVYGYGSSVAWRNFFEGREMYRGVPQGRRGHFVQVHHTEVECHFASTNNHDGSVSFMNFTRMDSDVRPQSIGSSDTLMSDLTDRDVIKGGDRKLDQVLDVVARDMESGRSAPEAIFVNSSCLPEVTGDDIDAALDKLRKRLAGADETTGKDGKKRKIPILNLRNEPDPNAEIMRLAMEDEAFHAVAKRPGTINLVGLPRLRGYEDVLACLAESGIRLNCWALPELDMNTFRHFKAAELNVLHGWDWISARRRDLIASTGLPSLTPPGGPFGIEGTRAWLAAIADALGRRRVFDAVWDRRRRAIDDEWEALRARARGYRLGFVLGENGLARLVDPAKMMGLPMVPMLREMGFGVDCLVYDTGTPAPRDEGAYRLDYFATPDELEASLRASEAVAFYSDVYFDRRLTRTGKNIFSSNDFEMGMRGAPATLARLLQTCELSFFRTYGEYLGPVFLDRSTERPMPQPQRP